MSDAVSLLTMRTEVRRRSNLENATGFIPDAEINSLLNYRLKRLYNMLVAARGQEYYRKSATLSTSTNVSSYALSSVATDFFQLISVDCTVNGVQVSMAPYMENERNVFNGYPIPPTGNPLRYRLAGGNINFIPTPSGVTTIGLNYVPAYVALALDTDTFDGVSGFEEWAIWKVVAYCLIKDDADPSAANGEAMAIEQEIQSLAAQRDAGSAERVKDVTINSRIWPGWSI